MNIIDIFYKNIIPEASTGRIDCLTYYNIAFSTKLLEKESEYSCNLDNNDLLIPTLIIRNKEQFDNLLIEYVNLAMKFYDDDNFEEEILNYKLYDEEKRICKEKVILSLLFANATLEDFNNPIEFLRKRINFIYNNYVGNYEFGYCNSLKGNVSLVIEKDIINNETPYQMLIKVVSLDGETFEFPKVKFAISNDVIYIYAVQNKKNQDNPFCKKVNRVLYRIGEGFIQDNDDSVESLQDITASFLVSVNMGISFLSNLGFSKIIVPSFLVERWNAKNISNLLKIKQKKLSNEDALELFNNQEYLQYNITNKLIRTFLRLGCHYNNIDVLSFPFEIDSCLHIEINQNLLQCNNALLYETYMLTQNGINNKNYYK